jgi:hypothetical protein
VFCQTNPLFLCGVSISRQNREDGMELGSGLLKESKVSSCLVECSYAGPGRISGSLKLTAEISRQSPRMCATFQGWSTSAMQTCKTEVEGLAKVKKIKTTSQVTSRILYLSSCHSCRLGPVSPHRLQKILPEWANQLKASQATQSISSTQGLRGFHDSSLGRLPPAQHLTMYYVDPIDAMPRIPRYTANGPLHCLYRAIMFPKY